MARGGFRPGAGRPKGSGKGSVQGRVGDGVRSRLGRAEMDRVVAELRDGSPRFRTALEYAMHAINDPGTPDDVKVRLAVAAMPFQHAKLADKTVGKKDEAADAAKKAGEGRFATPAGPKLIVSNA